MSLEDLRALDPEAVAAQCGGSQSADDGPNPGNAGEQEAIVADDEHTEDPNTGAAETGTPASAEPAAERKGPRHASELVVLLQEADPSLDEASALELLQDLLNEGRDADKLPRVIGSPSQFVPAALEVQVRDYIEGLASDGADDASSAPIDQDDPSLLPSDDDGGGDDSDPTGLTEAELGDDESSVEPTSGVDQYREALRPLLVEAVQAHQTGDREARDRSAMNLAGEIYSQGCLLYKSLQVPGSEMEPLLFQKARPDGQSGRPESLTRDQLAHDPELIKKAWYHRAAVRFTSKVVEGEMTVQQALENFTWPSEGFFRSRLQKKSTFAGSVPPPMPTSDEAQPDADNSQLVGDADADPQPHAPEAEPTETGPSPIEVEQVEGRRVVRSGNLPPRITHSVTGGGPFTGGSTLPPPGPLEGPPAIQSGESGANATDDASAQPSKREKRGKARNEESILANLPVDVVEAAIYSVINDPDPVQCWAYRTPEEVRVEADRRLLLEYGAASAA